MLTQSLTHPLTRPLTSAVTEGVGGGFSPLSLFSGGVQGAWYDPSDLSTLFSDSAGTTPAVVDGPVGKMLDKSGNGNHRTQATTSLKPILRTAGGLYWLEYDGVDDGMVTASVNFSTTDKMTVWAGVRKLSDAATGIICELSSADTNAGTFYVAAPAASGASKFAFNARGSTLPVAISTTDVQYNAPISAVITSAADISGPSRSLRVNGVTVASSALTAGAGSFGNYPLYIGRRGGASLPFNGREYGIVIYGAASTGQQVASAERYLAPKTGVTLP